MYYLTGGKQGRATDTGESARVGLRNMADYRQPTLVLFLVTLASREGEATTETISKLKNNNLFTRLVPAP